MDRSITWPARVALASIVVGVALIPLAVSRSSGDVASATAPAESAGVRIQHEYITVLPETVASAETVKPATPGPERAPRARPVTSAGQGQRTFAEKARRALLGDGRYRPEPFPKR